MIFSLVRPVMAQIGVKNYPVQVPNVYPVTEILILEALVLFAWTVTRKTSSYRARSCTIKQDLD